MARLYLICGLPFAGKTTLADELVRQRGGMRIDIDRINAARGVGVAGAVITPGAWAASFAEAERQLVAHLEAGRAVVYDGHCWGRAQRDHLRALAAARGAPTTLIYLDIPEAIARARWQANRAAPRRHDVSDDNFVLAIALLEPPVDEESASVYPGTPDPADWVARLPR